MYYNWSIIGHEKELARLEQDFTGDNIHHAYLFVGPEKIGKFRVAKAVAKILQCPNNFCHTCMVCSQIEKRCHPDTIELEDDGESIKIGMVREILARLQMTGGSRHKVLLIQNIGRLTEEAANCLLKTLEEPAGLTVFLFTVNSLREILSTIVSRMRIVHFKKLNDAVLKAALRQRFPEVTDELLGQVITLSLGRSGRAIQLLSNPEMFAELKETYERIQFLQDKAGLASRMMAAQEIAADPGRMKTFCSFLAHILRQKMLDAPDQYSRQRFISSLENIHEALHLAAKNVNPRLLMENIMMGL